jgi:hypothetical protein
MQITFGVPEANKLEAELVQELPVLRAALQKVKGGFFPDSFSHADQIRLGYVQTGSCGTCNLPRGGYLEWRIDLARGRTL